MKKRILSLLLAALMVFSLFPVTAFATGTTYAITNGTPESAKETNHGYITVDETAAKGETVTVTVNPADGYQLKSLTVTPAAPATITIADVLATAENDFPQTTSEDNTPDSHAWQASLLERNQPRCKQCVRSRRLLYVGCNRIDVFRCGSFQNERCFHLCD